MWRPRPGAAPDARPDMSERCRLWMGHYRVMRRCQLLRDKLVSCRTSGALRRAKLRRKLQRSRRVGLLFAFALRDTCRKTPAAPRGWP
jgi:hypothetical protein